MTLDSLLLYCRAGFEHDLANEVTDKAALLGIYGYPQFTKQAGFILFKCYSCEDAQTLGKSLKFSELIFARQMCVATDLMNDLDPEDRITTLLKAAEDFPLCGDIRVEHADTSEGRELSKFCRKITVPLRQALRKRNKLTNKENATKPVMHVFFVTGTQAHVGYSLPSNNSDFPLGILRLKFPAAAPSRSTLKLDEALQLFIPASEQENRLAAGMLAVDLGACPGGWTYQLVQRGMFVEAVDNGAMDPALMETGQVSYFAEDGFKYQPKKKPVNWLVCDMIEQPQRVAKLMAQWLANGWCKETVFNLKLPMKKRYDCVMLAKSVVDEVMQKHGCEYVWQAKHLYHDREEVTVHMRLKNSKA